VTEREERQRRDQDAIMIEAAVVQGLRDEVERLTGLAQIMGEERDRAWTEHLIEREELKAENERLKAENERLKTDMARLKVQWEEAKREAEKQLYESGLKLGEAHKEIARLKLDRQNVKHAIEELLERYGQIASATPHYGVGRGGMKVVKDNE
jgi:predicted RNase H-like nuclease (RuvC/YqgF family)